MAWRDKLGAIAVVALLELFCFFAGAEIPLGLSQSVFFGKKCISLSFFHNKGMNA
jgi:hypothetical protein